MKMNIGLPWEINVHLLPHHHQHGGVREKFPTGLASEDNKLGDKIGGIGCGWLLASVCQIKGDWSIIILVGYVKGTTLTSNCKSGLCQFR